VHTGYEPYAIDHFAIVLIGKCDGQLVAVARYRENVVAYCKRARNAPQRIGVR
jgi:hypothetical protein